LLHERGSHARGPLVSVDCGAFQDAALDDELFGRGRNGRKHPGKIEAARGGTIVLDEIAEMPLAVQGRLVRLLDEGAIEPAGGGDTVKLEARVIATTARDLRARVAEGRFREDLFYRINAISIVVPPLRDRRGDLPILVEHLLRQHAPKGEPAPQLSGRAWAALTHYPFPGNVRELAHAIEHAALLARGSGTDGGETIDIDHLPNDIVAATASLGRETEPMPVLAASMKEFERGCLLRALAVSGGKRTKAAEMLGISRKNLWEKLKAHGLSDSDLDDEA
jgi:DNA-binding NtrC family response regulator